MYLLQECHVDCLIPSNYYILKADTCLSKIRVHIHFYFFSVIHTICILLTCVWIALAESFCFWWFYVILVLFKKSSFLILSMNSNWLSYTNCSLRFDAALECNPMPSWWSVHIAMWSNKQLATQECLRFLVET